MGRPYQVTIRKQGPYQNQTNESWANIYHYRTADTEPDTVPTQSLADEIWSLEQNIVANSITAIEAYVNGPTDGTQQENKFQAVYDLTGTGEQPDDPVVSAELCVLFYWTLGRYGKRNAPQFLRKYLRLCGRGGGLTDAQIGVRDAIAGSEPSAFAAYQGNIAQIQDINGTDWLLCAPGGQLPTNSQAFVGSYMNSFDVGH